MPDPSDISASQVKSLLEVVRLLTVTADIDLLFGHIAEAVTTMLDCDRASIFLYDRQRDELWTKIALQSGEIRVPADVGIVGHSFRRNEVINVPDAYNDSRFYRGADRETGFTKTLLTVPMLDLTGNPVGVVQALNRRQGTFGPTDEVLLQLLANQAAVAFQRSRLQADALKMAVLQREMDLGRRVQQALFPDLPLILPWAHADGWMQSANQTGGDCLDVWCTKDGRLGIFLGDASGHGLAPALIISQVRALIRVLSDLETDPYLILQQINERLWHDLEEIKFVTAFLGFLTADGKLDWFSAGQGPIFYRVNGESPLQPLAAILPPLAAELEFSPSAANKLKLEPGGMLCAISDGIFEAFNRTGEQYGSDRAVQLLEALRGSPPHHLITALRSAILAWQNADTPTDDQSILVVAMS